jgi:hypothetical protein
MEDSSKELYRNRQDKNNNPNLTNIKINKLINESSENLRVTIKKVRNALKQMKNNKTPSIDQIVTEAISWGRKKL